MEPAETPEEQENRLYYVWHMIRKRLWMIIAVFGVVTMTVGIDTLKMKPVYQATAQLLIEMENPDIISFNEAVGKEAVRDPAVSYSSYYQTQYRILQSRSLALKVIRALQLRHNADFTARSAPGIVQTVKRLPDTFLKTGLKWAKQLRGTDGAATMTAMAVPTDPDKALIGRFLGRLRVQPVSNTRLVEISFKAANPALAAQIANTLARIYVDQNLETRFEASQQAVDWLHQRVAEMRGKVEKSELALHQYKEQHGIISLEERQNVVVQELADLNATLTRASTELIGAETLYQEVIQFAAHPDIIESMPPVVNNTLVQSLKQSYADLQHSMAELERRWGPRHPGMIQYESKLAALESKIEAEIQKVIYSVKTDYQIEKSRVQGLQDAFDRQKHEAQRLNEKSIEYSALKREVESNRHLYDTLLDSMKKTGISMELKRNNVRVIDAAETPRGPVGPNLMSNLTRASILSLVIGIGLAFFLESVDRTIKTPEEAQALLHLPILGAVGYFGMAKLRGKKGENGLITIQQPHSQPAEAFKTLCTNLLLNYAENPQTVLLVTSPHPQDGKTTVASNLAVGMAQMGRHVLLVDADLRHPSQQKLFGLEDHPGLSSLLAQENLTDIDAPYVWKESLSFMPAGICTSNPLELFGSERMQRFVELARERYDIVILDTPPSLVVSDAMMLSPLVDGMIMVLKCGSTQRSHAKRLVAQLTGLQADRRMGQPTGASPTHKLLGVVMNYLRPHEMTSYYYYGYNSYYQNQFEQSDKEKVVSVSPTNGHNKSGHPLSAG